jgi:ribose transport system ATP-binding protein
VRGTALRLEMRGMAKRFGATVALDGVDLEVRAGEIHALLGENGAGKSTLMKILSGAVQPDGGTMKLDGEPFRPRQPLEARRSGIAMIYQELSLAPHLTVAENLLLGMEPVRWGLIQRRRARLQVAAALEALEHPEIAPETRIADLGVAARQLVEIARSLIGKSRLLVLDEPTSSLSGQDVERLFGLMRRLREGGMAIVYISHFLEEVQRIADRFTVLRDGRTAGGGDPAAIPVAAMVERMVGRELRHFFPRSARNPGEVILEVRDLQGSLMPRNVSFALRRGEVLGIAGLVGAGRTELLRALFGLEPVLRGDIRLGGYRGPASPRQRLAQGMGLLSEDRKGEGLAGSLSVADNLTLSRLEGLGPAGLVWPGRQRQTTDRWIGRLGIRCQGAGQRVADLSGGNQQKVALARLLHQDADVLLLDEPTRGIDVASRAQIYELIDGLACRGKAVVLVSSYLPELLGIADRIAVICRGSLGSARPVAEVDEQALMLAAMGQENAGAG